jgi:hypothetical protein
MYGISVRVESGSMSSFTGHASLTFMHIGISPLGFLHCADRYKSPTPIRRMWARVEGLWVICSLLLT